MVVGKLSDTILIISYENKAFLQSFYIFRSFLIFKNIQIININQIKGETLLYILDFQCDIITS